MLFSYSIILYVIPMCCSLVFVTGRMRGDRSSRVRCMASRNYGGNGGHILIVVAQAATQLN